MEHRHVCEALIEWAALKEDAEQAHLETGQRGRFESAWSEVYLQITKSCLLDRMLNHDEKPSKTPCPVHNGRWSGCHWPGTVEIDGRWHREWTVIKTGERTIGESESEIIAEWRAAGCRCFLHKCGCTTGWQPDEHCGCAPVEA